MEAQEVFNQVVKHLRQQNATSFLEGGDVCAYRGANGRSCAVGCLIKDDEYDPDMERRDVDNLLGYAKLFLGKHELYERLWPHANLLRSLQDCHDNWDITKWEQRFQSIAKDYSLTMLEP